MCNDRNLGEAAKRDGRNLHHIPQKYSNHFLFDKIQATLVYLSMGIFTDNCRYLVHKTSLFCIWKSIVRRKLYRSNVTTIPSQNLLD